MPNTEDLIKMRECSPIIYAKNVRAPVLMLIGGKDRRVPMSQGVSYYHNLKAKGNSFSMINQACRYSIFLINNVTYATNIIYRCDYQVTCIP